MPPLTRATELLVSVPGAYSCATLLTTSGSPCPLSREPRNFNESVLHTYSRFCLFFSPACIPHHRFRLPFSRRPQNRGISLPGVFVILLLPTTAESWYCSFGSFVFCFFYSTYQRRTVVLSFRARFSIPSSCYHRFRLPPLREARRTVVLPYFR